MVLDANRRRYREPFTAPMVHDGRVIGSFSVEGIDSKYNINQDPDIADFDALPRDVIKDMVSDIAHTDLAHFITRSEFYRFGLIGQTENMVEDIARRATFEELYMLVSGDFEEEDLVSLIYKYSLLTGKSRNSLMKELEGIDLDDLKTDLVSLADGINNQNMERFAENIRKNHESSIDNKIEILEGKMNREKQKDNPDEELIDSYEFYIDQWKQERRMDPDSTNNLYRKFAIFNKIMNDNAGDREFGVREFTGTMNEYIQDAPLYPAENPEYKKLTDDFTKQFDGEDFPRINRRVNAVKNGEFDFGANPPKRYNPSRVTRDDFLPYFSASYASQDFSCPDPEAPEPTPPPTTVTVTETTTTPTTSTLPTTVKTGIPTTLTTVTPTTIPTTIAGEKTTVTTEVPTTLTTESPTTLVTTALVHTEIPTTVEMKETVKESVPTTVHPPVMVQKQVVTTGPVVHTGGSVRKAFIVKLASLLAK